MSAASVQAASGRRGGGGGIATHINCLSRELRNRNTAWRNAIVYYDLGGFFSARGLRFDDSLPRNATKCTRGGFLAMMPCQVEDRLQLTPPYHAWELCARLVEKKSSRHSKLNAESDSS